MSTFTKIKPEELGEKLHELFQQTGGVNTDLKVLAQSTSRLIEVPRGDKCDDNRGAAEMAAELARALSKMS
jgi:hypothetical protein